MKDCLKDPAAAGGGSASAGATASPKPAVLSADNPFSTRLQTDPAEARQLFKDIRSLLDAPKAPPAEGADHSGTAAEHQERKQDAPSTPAEALPQALLLPSSLEQQPPLPHLSPAPAARSAGTSMQQGSAARCCAPSETNQSAASHSSFSFGANPETIVSAQGLPAMRPGSPAVPIQDELHALLRRTESMLSRSSDNSGVLGSNMQSFPSLAPANPWARAAQQQPPYPDDASGSDGLPPASEAPTLRPLVRSGLLCEPCSQPVRRPAGRSTSFREPLVDEAPQPGTPALQQQGAAEVWALDGGGGGSMRRLSSFADIGPQGSGAPSPYDSGHSADRTTLILGQSVSICNETPAGQRYRNFAPLETYVDAVAESVASGAAGRASSGSIAAGGTRPGSSCGRGAQLPQAHNIARLKAELSSFGRRLAPAEPQVFDAMAAQLLQQLQRFEEVEESPVKRFKQLLEPLLSSAFEGASQICARLAGGSAQASRGTGPEQDGSSQQAGVLSHRQPGRHAGGDGRGSSSEASGSAGGGPMMAARAGSRDSSQQAAAGGSGLWGVGAQAVLGQPICSQPAAAATKLLDASAAACDTSTTGSGAGPPATVCAQGRPTAVEVQAVWAPSPGRTLRIADVLGRQLPGTSRSGQAAQPHQQEQHQPGRLQWSQSSPCGPPSGRQLCSGAAAASSVWHSSSVQGWQPLAGQAPQLAGAARVSPMRQQHSAQSPNHGSAASSPVLLMQQQQQQQQQSPADRMLAHMRVGLASPGAHGQRLRSEGSPLMVAASCASPGALRQDMLRMSWQHNRISSGMRRRPETSPAVQQLPHKQSGSSVQAPLEAAAAQPEGFSESEQLDVQPEMLMHAGFQSLQVQSMQPVVISISPVPRGGEGFADGLCASRCKAGGSPTSAQQHRVQQACAAAGVV